MQTGKNAVAIAKEKAQNVGASARSGMEKTKATAQEKVEKMRAHDPADKNTAEQRKEMRIQHAEMSKRAAMEENAAEKEAKARSCNAGLIGEEHHHSTLGHGTDSTIPRSPILGEQTLTGGGAAGHETGGRYD